MSILFKRTYRLLQKLHICLYKSFSSQIPYRSTTVANRINFRYFHDYNESENVEEQEEMKSVAELYEETPTFVRNALYPESKNPVINSLIQCTSIQEVLDIIKLNSNNLSNEQVTQAFATFWDLVKVLLYLNGMPETKETIQSSDVVQLLINKSEFHILLKFIEKNISTFNATDLSYIQLYLSKLCLDENHSIIRLITETMKSKLMEDFSLYSASRFVTSCFSEYSLKSHFHVQRFIPLIFNEIENCSTAEKLKFLTICINSTYSFLTEEMLEKYKETVNRMIDDTTLRMEDSKVILRIMVFLNNPTQRVQNIDLIRKCSVLVKRKISEMNASDVCLVADIFQANQESAEILNEIQRNATKHFLQMEEESHPNMYLRLQLLSALIIIATPHQRHQYNSVVVKYAKEDLHLDALFVLRKILSDIKISDRNMCNRLWDQIHHYIIKSNDRNVLKLVSEYVNFNADIVNFRHIRFENLLTLIIDKELEQGIFYSIPSILAHVALLYIPYSNSRKKIEKIVNKLCESWAQFTSIDWLKISKAIQTAREITNNEMLLRDDCVKIKKACDAFVSKNIGSLNLRSITLLLKCYIFRDEISSRLVDYLMIAVSANQQMSSILMKNAVYCFRNTQNYSPDILDKMSSYICDNYNHLLGTTIEKYLYFCYYVNHLPQNSDRFFQVVTDVLIRDTERMNGLTYLQAALALCYFHKLPHSFIKHIFNVSFLEKLDTELAACYAKETYPFRVRHIMMQLNRAVCLDYPEVNVPWFHEKYIQERKAVNEKLSNQENVFYLQVYESLLEITNNPKFIIRKFDAPYGYFIDFVVALNKTNEITDPINGAIATQFALLLPKGKKAYLRFGNQLIGQYKLKQRHLEILGYKTAFINPKDWWLLTSNKDKINYLKSIIWPDKVRKYAATSDR